MSKLNDALKQLKRWLSASCIAHKKITTCVINGLITSVINGLITSVINGLITSVINGLIAYVINGLILSQADLSMIIIKLIASLITKLIIA